MQEWILAGSPQSLEYTELGPGRGTLAKDILTTVDELKQKVKFGSDVKIQVKGCLQFFRFVSILRSFSGGDFGGDLNCAIIQVKDKSN